MSREQDSAVPKLVTTTKADLYISDSLVNLCPTENDYKNDVNKAADSENVDTSLTAPKEDVQTEQSARISHCIDKSNDCVVDSSFLR